MSQCFIRVALTILLLTCVVKCAEIIKGPVTQVVHLGQNATFECNVVGFGTWYINGQAIDPLDGRSAFESRGFFSSISEEQDGAMTTVTSLVLRVDGRKENNGSKIQCYGYDFDVAISTVALLIVQDAIEAPSPPSKDGISCDQSSLGGRLGLAACTQAVTRPTDTSVPNLNTVAFQNLPGDASSTFAVPSNAAFVLVVLWFSVFV